ncbi:MAG: hypothetical protein RL095_2836 [Verrucomicrobiota bacterium]|jgi:hypothetical protein
MLTTAKAILLSAIIVSFTLLVIATNALEWRESRGDSQAMAGIGLVVSLLAGLFYLFKSDKRAE